MESKIERLNELFDKLLELGTTNWKLVHIIHEIPQLKYRAWEQLLKQRPIKEDFLHLLVQETVFDLKAWDLLLKSRPTHEELLNLLKDGCMSVRPLAVAYVLSHRPTRKDVILLLKRLPSHHREYLRVVNLFEKMKPTQDELEEMVFHSDAYRSTAWNKLSQSEFSRDFLFRVIRFEGSLRQRAWRILLESSEKLTIDELIYIVDNAASLRVEAASMILERKDVTNDQLMHLFKFVEKTRLAVWNELRSRKSKRAVYYVIFKYPEHYVKWIDMACQSVLKAKKYDINALWRIVTHVPKYRVPAAKKFLSGRHAEYELNYIYQNIPSLRARVNRLRAKQKKVDDYHKAKEACYDDIMSLRGFRNPKH